MIGDFLRTIGILLIILILLQTLTSELMSYQSKVQAETNTTIDANALEKLRNVDREMLGRLIVDPSGYVFCDKGKR